MKRILTAILIGITAISLCACGQKTPEQTYESLLKEIKKDIDAYTSDSSSIDGLPDLLQYAIANLDGDTVISKLVYAIADINEDDTPELLIAYDFSSTTDLVGVYGIENGETKIIINPAYDSYYTLLKSGKVLNEGTYVESYYYKALYHFEGNELVPNEYAYTTSYDPETGVRDDSTGYTIIGTDLDQIQDVVLGRSQDTTGLQVSDGTTDFWNYAADEEALTIDYIAFSEVK